MITAAALSILTRLAASAPAGARPAHAPRALRPVADVRMPMHATIIRGRRHLRVALEFFSLELFSRESLGYNSDPAHRRF